mmetsp:Transcript_11094/g.51411  ORF Transcript_11094/g.51411 Transcript_11094/m.51411 type:complete len:230 (-) Transcript_11094:795-1484(-)
MLESNITADPQTLPSKKSPRPKLVVHHALAPLVGLGVSPFISCDLSAFFHFVFVSHSSSSSSRRPLSIRSRRHAYGIHSRGGGVGIVLDAHAVHLRLLGELHLVGETKEFEHADAHPGHVDLPPLQPVPGGELKGVVVVVPPLAERQDPDPPVVARQVTRVVRLAPPHVRDGVDRPRDVVHPARADAETPHEPGQAAHRVHRHSLRQHVPHVRLLHEPIKRLRREFLRV